MLLIYKVVLVALDGSWNAWGRHLSVSDMGSVQGL